MPLASDLDRYLTELEQHELFSGVVRITRGEVELYARALGYANRSWMSENSLETRFDTASITKLFTAVATLELIDQGAFAFDTRVIDYLDLRGTVISREVTVFHLLTHSSGIGDDCEEENGEIYEELWRCKPNYAVITTADFLPQFVHKPANFPPGAGCRYCNCGYILLGLAIEQATGLSYREVIRECIFKPAGMVDSGFLRMDRVHENVAEGSDPIRDAAGEVVAWKKNIYSFPPIGSPDSGAQVTAADLDRFLRAVKTGDLCSRELADAFFMPQVHYRTYDTWIKMYGYGLWFHVDRDQEVVYCEKEGINAGVSGVIRHYPAGDINVVILSNMESGAWKPLRQIANLVVADQLA